MSMMTFKRTKAGLMNGNALPTSESWDKTCRALSRKGLFNMGSAVLVATAFNEVDLVGAILQWLLSIREKEGMPTR